MAGEGVGSLLHRVVLWAERIYEGLRHRVRDLFVRSESTLEIVPYRTYGTPDYLEIRGRLLVARSRRPPDASDSWLRNVTRTVKRFITYEMPDFEVRVARGGEEKVGRTDEEGYFRIGLPIQGAMGWTAATASAHRAPPVDAQVLVPAPTCRFLVVSDIDDTILPTGATRTATLIRTTLLGNAQTRTPFPGITDFYTSLVTGAGGNDDNPIFYVSSSPWNLYSFMANFFEAHGLPVGPVMLRDFGVDEETFIHGSHEDHKLFEIRKILNTYPHLPCVLVGDSGQRDPEIYTTVAGEFPDRVLAIYVREIGGDARQREVEQLGAEIDVPLVSGTDTSEFSSHAASIGLIVG